MSSARTHQQTNHSSHDPARSHSIGLVGPLPPPIHGQALVNEWLVKALRREGATVVVLNTAARALGRGYRTRLVRLLRIVRILGEFGKLALARRLTAVLVSTSGGLGRVYDILFLLVARLLGIRRFVHHHSYGYLNRPSRLTSLLTKIAGGDSTHIALCDDQAARLMACYPSVRHVVVLPNAAFLEQQLHDSVLPKPQLRTVGFLGNLSLDKGLAEVLAIAARAGELALDLRFVIAGPIGDRVTRDLVNGHLTHLPGLEYVGPQYDEGKAAFLRQIDALLFPSRYFNEADPLTVYEALAAAVPVIAWGRGCIQSVLHANCGLVISTEADFVTPALRCLVHWTKHPDEFVAASTAARARFVAITELSQTNLSAALTLLVRRETR